ncbi:MAG: hypothetical protein LUG65_05340 [Clostridiales bacterium]|nr:hypothetical protein [Clostridiales bacterium]
MGKWLAPDGSIRNIREDMGMEHFASGVLTEENYNRYRKSCNFMFWFQLIGILAGFLVPFDRDLYSYSRHGNGLLRGGVGTALDDYMADCQYACTAGEDMSKICEMV